MVTCDHLGSFIALSLAIEQVFGDQNVHLESEKTNFGILEMKIDENWVTVCNMGFNHHTAHLVCNEMGFPRARKFTTRYQYHMENHVRYKNPISYCSYDMKHMI